MISTIKISVKISRHHSKKTDLKPTFFKEGFKSVIIFVAF